MDRIANEQRMKMPIVLHRKINLLSLLIMWIIAGLALAGCGGGGSSSTPGAITPTQQNTAPSANAGTDIVHSISSTAVSLDCSGSSDPEQDALMFSWTVTEQPAGAGISLNNATTSSPSFVSMVPGVYRFELTVTDPAGLSGSDTVAVTLVNEPPTISVAPLSGNIVTGEDVTIDASASADPNGHSLTYTWELTQRPNGSGMQTTYQGAVPTLRFDVQGHYVFQLQVSDAYESATVTLDPITVLRPGPNTAPTANAGHNLTLIISPAAVTLDGSSSSDPENDALTFSWTITEQPTGADITLSDATAASPGFQPMVPGDYAFELTVTDFAGLSDTDTVSISMTNSPPEIAVEPFSRNPAVGIDLTLDASGSSDPNGHSLTYSWELTELPIDSGMQTTYQGATPTLHFDVQGEYTLQLEVSDGYESATMTWNPIVVTAFDVTMLDNGFIDAEFDKIGKRVVTVLDDTLFVINADGTENAVDLPVSAAAVSVAPDGATAAVAHDGWISHIDLNSLSVLDTHSVPANLGDIVIDGQGYAYGFPASDQWVNIHVLNLETGAVQQNTGGSIRDDTRAKLHPSGTKIYGADNGLSPSDIERYAIGNGTANLDYDSPYHGDFPFCGDLWFGPEGDTLLTRCRVVVRTTDYQPSDMGFVMQLDDQSNGIQHASSSAFENRWFVIDRNNINGSNNIKVYDVQSGNHLETLELPFVDSSWTRKWIAKFVFAVDDATSLYVLAVDEGADPKAYALLRSVDPNTSNSNRAPQAVVRRFSTVEVSDPVTLDASDSIDPEGQPLTYQWALVAEPAGSTISPGNLTSETLVFTPTVAGVYEFELTVDDGVRRSPLARSTVNVFEPTTSLVHRLQGQVVDAEFSKSLNALIYLSALDQSLRILDVADFSETVVELEQAAYSIGVSPDGLFAAISHAGKASLVDLTLATVTDTQSYTDDWGDIVLDHNYRAHLVPNRDQWSHLVSLDFTADLSDTEYGARAGTQIRMHPVSGWVYGADRGLSPSDFEKWDVTTFPSNSLGDSPYHGDHSISGNIWISEDGERLVVASGNTFRSIDDPTSDMIYMGGIADNVLIQWADHSTEAEEWAVVTAVRQYTSDDTLDGKLIFYDDTYFNQVQVEDLAPIPTATSAVPTKATRVFYSDDGADVIVLLEGEGIVDNVAVQIWQP